MKSIENVVNYKFIVFGLGSDSIPTHVVHLMWIGTAESISSYVKNERICPW